MDMFPASSELFLDSENSTTTAAVTPTTSATATHTRIRNEEKEVEEVNSRLLVQLTPLIIYTLIQSHPIDIITNCKWIHTFCYSLAIKNYKGFCLYFIRMTTEYILNSDMKYYHKIETLAPVD